MWTKLWNWLNGNKTTIGLVLGYVTAQVWFVNMVGVDVVNFLQWFAGTFIGVGLLHKVVKADTTSGSNK
jgi:hypothetical protein